MHGGELTVDDAIAKMEILRPYKGMYAALGILYNSCDDVDGRLQPVFESITAEWAGRG